MRLRLRLRARPALAQRALAPLDVAAHAALHGEQHGADERQQAADVDEHDQVAAAVRGARAAGALPQHAARDRQRHAAQHARHEHHLQAVVAEVLEGDAVAAAAVERRGAGVQPRAAGRAGGRGGAVAVGGGGGARRPGGGSGVAVSWLRGRRRLRLRLRGHQAGDVRAGRQQRAAGPQHV